MFPSRAALLAAAACAVFSFAVLGCAAESTATEQANITVVERFYEEALNNKNLDVIEEIFHPEEFVSTVPPAGPAKVGHEDIKNRWGTALAAVPDAHFSLEYVVADGDWVTVHWRATGSHDGNDVDQQGVTRFRLADGVIVESVHITDNAALREQLGQSRSAAEAANVAVVERFYDEVVNGKNLDAVDALFHPDDYVSATSSADATSRSHEEIKSTWKAAFDLVPDAQYTLEKVIAEGDWVTVHWRATGSHNGNSVEQHGITAFRVEDGQIVETVHVTDNAHLQDQL
jgi:ketosteroid isomerase-like protein